MRRIAAYIERDEWQALIAGGAAALVCVAAPTFIAIVLRCLS